jgi:anti-anti-sigma factor
VEVELSSLRGTPLLRFQGEIGNESRPRLRLALEAALRQGTERLLLDLSAVPYIDGGCLGLIGVMFEDVAELRWLGIIGANAHIERLFWVMGFEKDDALRFFPTPEDAKMHLASNCHPSAIHSSALW